MDYLMDFFVRVAAGLVEMSAYLWQLGWRKCVLSAVIVLCLTAIVVGLVHRAGGIGQH